jgi:Glycosyltransferase family 87
VSAKINFRLALAICLAICLYWIFVSITFPTHDFANTYFAAYFFQNGQFKEGIFDPYSFNKKIALAGFTGIYGSFNPNPPFIAWLFSPFSYLPLAYAKLFFNLIGVALFVTSSYRLAKFLNVKSPYIFILIPIIFFVPVRNQILFGQSYFLLYFLLVEGFLAYEKKRTFVSSLLWALAIFIKVFPVVLFLWLAIQKKWKSTFWLAGVCLVLLAISVGFQGVEIWKTFLFEILPSHQQGHISSEFTTNYQSVHMLLKYLLVEEPLLNPSPLLDSPTLMQIGLTLFSSFILTLVCSLVRLPAIVSFSFLVASSLLLSPYSSTYSLILIVPLCLALWGRESILKISTLSFLILLAANWSVLSIHNTAFTFARLFLQVAVILFAFYTLHQKIKWPYLLLFAPILSLGWLFKSAETEGARMLSNENHNLIFDYGVVNQRLVYQYWNESGENSLTTDLRVSEWTADQTQIVDNQIVFNGRRLTNSRSKKIKPMLINNDTIVFLSDYNKGRGFYTLRYLPIRN